MTARATSTLRIETTCASAWSIPAGTIGTIAGGGTGDGGAAKLAGLDQPQGVAMDSSGQILNCGQHQQPDPEDIRKWDHLDLRRDGRGGLLGGKYPHAATSAQLNNPVGVAVDTAGNVYIADQWNNRVREVLANGPIVTFAGTGNCCFSNAQSGGQATAANLNNILRGLAVGSFGDVYIADWNDNRILKVDTTGKDYSLRRQWEQWFWRR